MPLNLQTAAGDLTGLAMLRKDAISALLGLSVRTLERRIASGEVPPPVRLGSAPNSPLGWPRQSVADYLNTLSMTAGAASGASSAPIESENQAT